jgi:uracil-DNA glycosylase family protein
MRQALGRPNACRNIVGSRSFNAAMGDVATEGYKQALEAERAIEPRSNTRAAWEAILEEARVCTRCDLYKYATQTVFGEGPLDASILFVGEQPGDQEDLAGRPFVGPAGAVFDEALEKAGIDRSTVYVTNAVKHFKFIPRGKRRIHNKPDAGEITACRWWIEQERGLIKPDLTVALGATAARSLLGKVVTIGKVRGEPLALADGSECWVTVHPSSLLRIPDPEGRREARALFVRDLKRIKSRAAELAR